MILSQYDLICITASCDHELNSVLRESTCNIIKFTSEADVNCDPKLLATFGIAIHSDTHVAGIYSDIKVPVPSKILKSISNNTQEDYIRD